MDMNKFVVGVCFACAGVLVYNSNPAVGTLLIVFGVTQYTHSGAKE